MALVSLYAMRLASGTLSPKVCMVKGTVAQGAHRRQGPRADPDCGGGTGAPYLTRLYYICSAFVNRGAEESRH